MDDGTGDGRATALRAHRGRLVERVEHATALLRAVDRTLERLEKGGMRMDAERMFDGFEGFDHAQHADEAEERWGDTDAWKESQRRLKGMSKGDARKLKEEQDDIWRRMADLMKSGASPEGSEAVALAEEARLFIDRRFYPCSPSDC